jgi:hypothetical protein
MRTLPRPELEKIRIEQECRLPGKRACRSWRARYGAGGLPVASSPCPSPTTRGPTTALSLPAGVIREHAKGTRQITRLPGGDLFVLYPGLLDAVLAAQHQVARPATMPGRPACVGEITALECNVSNGGNRDGNQRHEEG